MISKTDHTLPGQSKTTGSTQPQQNKPSQGADLRDSRNDEVHLQSDEADLELPDVEDIPGQEHAASPLGHLAGTTISSADEEGEGLLDRDEEEEVDENGIVMGTDADITKEEIDILENNFDYMPDEEEDNLRKATLDNTDDDGDLLNEDAFEASGRDLDVPGSEEDDDTEDLGDEDEENNSYSLGGDNHDL